MPDACIQDSADIRADFNFNNTGGDFKVVDSSAGANLLVCQQANGNIALLAGVNAIFQNANGTLVFHRKDAGVVAEFQFGGTALMRLDDDGQLRFGGGNAGLVLNVRTSNPG